MEKNGTAINRVVLVRQGRKFPKECVTALLNTINVPVVTLTDQQDTPGKTRPLCNLLMGWWAKIEVFSPENADLRPCLYMDLDTFVVGDLKPYLIDTTELHLLRDFNISTKSETGLMIVPRETKHIWDDFMRDRTRWISLGADGKFTSRYSHKIIQDEIGGVHSYKNECRKQPKGNIVCFHGKPKPGIDELDGWASTFWRTALKQ